MLEAPGNLKEIPESSKLTIDPPADTSRTQRDPSWAAPCRLAVDPRSTPPPATSSSRTWPKQRRRSCMSGATSRWIFSANPASNQTFEISSWTFLHPLAACDSVLCMQRDAAVIRSECSDTRNETPNMQMEEATYLVGKCFDCTANWRLLTVIRCALLKQIAKSPNFLTTRARLQSLSLKSFFLLRNTLSMVFSKFSLFGASKAGAFIEGSNDKPLATKSLNKSWDWLWLCAEFKIICGFSRRGDESFACKGWESVWEVSQMLLPGVQ